jgi:hypothetical protein
VVIEFKWNNKTYKVNAFSISMQSAGSIQLADCIPGSINISLEVPPKASPAKDFFNFARTQHASAKAKGKGQISVFKGHDDKKEGQAIQTVTFDKANIVATEITISGEKFIHDARGKLFVE